MKLRNRAVVVDDHNVVRELLRFQLCRSEPHRYEIVREGANGNLVQID